MKGYLPIVVCGVFISFLLFGCLGGLGEQARGGEQGLAETRFESYSKLVGTEKGINTIEISNELSKDVSLKITLVEEENAWKIFEVPGRDTLRIEVGAADYLLEAQTEDGLSDEFVVTAGDVTVNITDDWFAD